jgi:deoxyadenosine/deoxycytidine kinase
MGLMAERDFQNYFDLFKLMSSQVNAPDLLIYLKANVSTLVNHIQKRGRDYESTMSIDYLKRLNDRYEEWISGYTEGKLLVLNVDDLDYKSNADDTAFVIQKVSEALGI